MEVQALGCQLGSLARSLLDLVLAPESFRVLATGCRQPEAARAIIELASSHNQVEELILVCVQNSILATLDINLIFRSENLYTKILSELCKETCSTFIRDLLMNLVGELVTKKTSEKKILKITRVILERIYNEFNYFPTNFHRLCVLVVRQMRLISPNSDTRLAMVNLIFLRFLCPLILDLAHGEHVSNVITATKTIQNLASSALFTNKKRITDKFILKNLPKMKQFLEVLGKENIVYLPLSLNVPGTDLKPLIRFVSGSAPSLPELQPFFGKIAALADENPIMYNQVIDFYNFSLRTRLQTVSADDFLGCSPETRKRLLVRGFSEPIPHLRNLERFRTNLHVGCSSDR